MKHALHLKQREYTRGWAEEEVFLALAFDMYDLAQGLRYHRNVILLSRGFLRLYNTAELRISGIKLGFAYFQPYRSLRPMPAYEM